MSVKIQQVVVATAPADLDAAVEEGVLFHCGFCGKGALVSATSRRMCERLSRPQDTYCRFCLRHGLHRKNNRHTLIMSFRSVIGYFYLNHYKAKSKLMYVSQVRDFVEAHEGAGMTNPVFNYDRESFLWFVDFERVGSTGRRVPVDDVLKTVANIMACFNLFETVPGLRMHKFFQKYKEAVDLFYRQRLRPEGKKILCPTFQGCGVVESKDLPFDRTREFLPQDLV